MIRFNPKTGRWSDELPSRLCSWLAGNPMIGKSPLAVTIDGSATGGSTSATTIVYTLTKAHPVGSPMVLGISTGAITISGVADTRGNTWTPRVSNAANNARNYIYTALLTTALQVGDQITVTFSATTNRRVVSLSRIDNGSFGVAVDASGANDNVTSGGATTTPSVATSAPTTNAVDAVFGVFGSGLATGPNFTSESAGWNTICDLTYGGSASLAHHSYAIVNAVGTQTYQITVSTSPTQGEMCVLALKGQ